MCSVKTKTVKVCLVSEYQNKKLGDGRDGKIRIVTHGRLETLAHLLTGIEEDMSLKTRQTLRKSS